jgi:hypothetical protein
MTEIEARFILGLSPSFSEDDLKRAYRRAAADNHPDRGGNAERMVLVNEAFETLSGGGRHVSEFQPSSEPAPSEEPAHSDPAPPSSDQPSSDDEPVSHPIVGQIAFVFALLFWIFGLVSGVVKDRKEWFTLLFLGLPLLWFAFCIPVQLLVICCLYIHLSGLRVQRWLRSRGIGVS